MQRHVYLLFGTYLLVAAVATASHAQQQLPDVSVTESAKDIHHGGYVISTDFQVDTHMSAVIFPAQALRAGDILSVQPLKMGDDEYFVLQECVTTDCTTARVWRVWGAFGSTTSVHDKNRIAIEHDGKYFMFMKKIRAATGGVELDLSDQRVTYQNEHKTNEVADQWFTQFEKYGPPLTLKPVGALASLSRIQLEEAGKTGIVAIAHTEREAGSFLAVFATGTKIRLQRMHPEN